MGGAMPPAPPAPAMTNEELKVKYATQL
jgi:hypothetical protein